jgi:hypothetical protein
VPGGVCPSCVCLTCGSARDSVSRASARFPITALLQEGCVCLVATGVVRVCSKRYLVLSLSLTHTHTHNRASVRLCVSTRQRSLLHPAVSISHASRPMCQGWCTHPWAHNKLARDLCTPNPSRKPFHTITQSTACAEARPNTHARRTQHLHSGRERCKQPTGPHTPGHTYCVPHGCPEASCCMAVLRTHSRHEGAPLCPTRGLIHRADPNLAPASWPQTPLPCTCKHRYTPLHSHQHSLSRLACVRCGAIVCKRGKHVSDFRHDVLFSRVMLISLFILLATRRHTLAERHAARAGQVTSATWRLAR